MTATTGSTPRVLQRMDHRVEALSADFAGHLARFAGSKLFSGPSWYFHRRTLRCRLRHTSVSSLMEDDEYFDALYATLTAWGLHRMGPGNTKLLELDVIRASVGAIAAELDRLVADDIATLPTERRRQIVDVLWGLIQRLRVSKAEARIVANSKLLHHVLPDLVPPMDRQYTYRFFYGRTGLSIDEEVAFREMFGRLLEIAGQNRTSIQATTGTDWNTCPSKVVDNAIVGFMLSHKAQSARPRRQPEPAG